MQIWTDIEDFTGAHPVITIGIFDGVHLGHRAILERLKQKAEQLKGESVVLTLWPHPRMVLPGNKTELKLLTSLEEKSELLDRNGIDHLLVMPFDLEFSMLTAHEFIAEILVKQCRIEHLVVGYNHRFGHDRQGNLKELRSHAKPYGFTIEKLDPYKIDDREVSSSLIRQRIMKGDISGTNVLLGYPYFFQGKVVGGNKIGRTIGFPTANIEPDFEHKLVPREGVYAVRVRFNGKTWPGMLNIGFRPTVDQNKTGRRSIEVHLPGFEGSMYDRHLKVSFVERIRDEMKFRDIDALKEQLQKDKKIIMKILESPDPAL